MIEEGIKLLEKDWANEEKILIQRLLDNLNSYKSFITKSLKQDITSVLKLASNIKDDYDTLKQKVNLIQSIILNTIPQENTQENTQKNTQENTQEHTKKNTQEHTQKNTQEHTQKNTQEHIQENILKNTQENTLKNISESEPKSKNGINKLKFWN